MRPARSPNPQLQATGVRRSGLAACILSPPRTHKHAKPPPSTMTPIKIPDLAYGAQAICCIATLALERGQEWVRSSRADDIAYAAEVPPKADRTAAARRTENVCQLLT